jgi:uncharacterized protein
MLDNELREYENIEVRSIAENKIQLSVPVGQESKLMKDKHGLPFKEVIPRSTWEGALLGDGNGYSDLKVHINHQQYVNIGKVDNVQVTNKEVLVDVTLSDNADGVKKAIEQRKLHSVSFGFKPLADTFDRVGNFFKRTVQEMKLVEFSLLDITPAYNNTDIQVRNLEIPHDLVEEERRKQQQMKLRIQLLKLR